VGFFDDIGSAVGDVAGDVGGAVSDVTSAISDVATQAARGEGFAGLLLNPIGVLTRPINSSPLGQSLANMIAPGVGSLFGKLYSGGRARPQAHGRALALDRHPGIALRHGAHLPGSHPLHQRAGAARRMRHQAFVWQGHGPMHVESPAPAYTSAPPQMAAAAMSSIAAQQATRFAPPSMPLPETSLFPPFYQAPAGSMAWEHTVLPLDPMPIERMPPPPPFAPAPIIDAPPELLPALDVSVPQHRARSFRGKIAAEDPNADMGTGLSDGSVF